MSGAARDNARIAALELLAAVLDGGRSLAEAHGDNAAESGPTDPRDRAFSRYLAYGVLRWLGALEWLSSQLLRHPLKSRDQDIQRLILLGLFQLWQGDSEAYAVVNESAECARLLKKPWAVGLVNAVLRRFQRERTEILERLNQQEARHAHPAWLLHILRTEWPEDWEAIVAANNQAGPLWLRLRQQGSAAEVAARLRQDGFSVSKHPLAPAALRVHPAAPVERLAGFAEGRFSVQDPAAQFAAGLLQTEPGQRVLDACAAPGGKTGHILETTANIELTAIDRSAGRLELVRQNLQRLGLADRRGLELRVADATEPDTWWDGMPYQRILLDAPCTATGVIRRHPEIKWLRTTEQVADAAALQAQLLQRLWPLLDVGGMLLYATCSVLNDENCRQIARFIANHPDARLSIIDAEWGHAVDPGRQILPGEEDMDGFYYARLRKV